MLDRQIEEPQVRKALKLTKNGSATGIDGCPYELWRALNEKHETDAKERRPRFDVIKTLTLVYQDIQTNSIDEKANFALGWMCPIYKKKDRLEISNYRLITLLNMDYKLLTKALAIQLTDDIDELIHQDQARFIPNRSIFNT